MSNTRFALAALTLLALLTAWSSFFIVPEGHVGVVKRFSKATHQVNPGIHFKTPFIDTVTDMEVRQRRLLGTLAAATKDLLAIKARVSINWTLEPQTAIDMYRRYGSLAQFENRILAPKLESAGRAAISNYPATELIQERLTAVQEILTAMRAEMQPFSHITVNAPQLENIAFPKAFTQAVERKEIAREDALTQQNVLDRQRLQAQEKVNTAKADAEAKRLAADAEAYRVTTEATAEAEAIRMINAELARSPNYIQLTVAKGWDGTLPSTVFGAGDSAIPMLQLPQPGANWQHQRTLEPGSSGAPANRQPAANDNKP